MLIDMLEPNLRTDCVLFRVVPTALTQVKYSAERSTCEKEAQWLTLAVPMLERLRVTQTQSQPGLQNGTSAQKSEGWPSRKGTYHYS